MIPSQDQIKRMHNGLIKCPIDDVEDWMPEIVDIVNSAPLPHREYNVDAKVHMLMPGQFPCIPNWHGDAIPRDADGNLLMDECNDDYELFLWLSGPPLTEFQDGRTITAGSWTKFKQQNIHRGVVSKDFCWRLFIRLMPNELVVRPRKGKACLRRHSQVYLDSNNFTW